jgi:hypothetical protein
VWTIGAGQTILRNGVQANGGFGSVIEWSGSAIYVYGIEGRWWVWTGAGWVLA